eukprot:9005370-Heterocapsa_arctica.AAC.1
MSTVGQHTIRSTDSNHAPTSIQLIMKLTYCITQTLLYRNKSEYNTMPHGPEGSNWKHDSV